jgi:hypothetical protein
VPNRRPLGFAGVVHLYPIAPVLLGSEHRNIGAMEEVVGFLTEAPLGYTDADGNFHMCGGNHNGFVGDVLPHAFGDLARYFYGAIGQHYEELFAPISANVVVLAHRTGHDFRRAAEYFISY